MTVVLILAAVLLAGSAGYLVLRDVGPMARNLRVVAPDTLAGRPRITDPAAQKQLDLMLTSTRDDPAVTSTRAGRASRPGTGRSSVTRPVSSADLTVPAVVAAAVITYRSDARRRAPESRLPDE